MPAKIVCPYTPDQLRALWDTHPSARSVERTMRDQDVTASYDVIIGWLKSAGVDVKHSSPFARTPCPFTAARLQELYWRQGLSCKAIADIARTAIEQPVSEAVAQRWLREAGVSLRKPAEWLRVRAIRDPESGKRQAQVMRDSPNYAPHKSGSKLTASARRKGVKAAAEKKRREETRRCAFPDCPNYVTRLPSLFRHPPERTYCSTACANRDRAERRRLGLD